MKKILITLLTILFLVALISATYNFRTIYNPFTQKLDYHITSNMSGENVTAYYFFGDGSYLTGLAGGGDINAVNTAGIYLTGGAESGTVNLLLNETVLNQTIDARAGAGAETDPHWTTNQSLYTTLTQVLGFSYYNSTDFSISDYFTKANINDFSYYNATTFDYTDYLLESNTTLVGNFSATTDFCISGGICISGLEAASGISWSDAVNGTLFTTALYNTNYTANDAAYRLDTDTFAANYSDFLALPTLAELVGFNYYNSTDFSISDYFTKTNILSFNYYNSTDFSISDYFTKTNILGFNYYNSTNPQTELDPYWTDNFTKYNSSWTTDTDTTYSHLTNFTDDLGNRGYTHLTNFTDDILWTTGFNTTGDSRWLGVGGETDPLWTGNYTAYNDSWTTTNAEIWTVVDNDTFVPYTGSNANVVLGDYNFSVGSTDLFVNANTGNVGINTTTPQNTLNVLGDGNFTGNIYRNNKLLIDWSDAVNGTLFTTVLYNTNYTANDAAYRSITNTSYYLATNPFSFYNSTDFSISDYFTKTNILGFNYWNDTYATFNKTYADTLYSTISEPLWSANYTIWNTTWSTDTTYSATGTLLDLTSTTFSVNAGTLTNTKGCKFVTGTGIVCDQDYLTSYTETDPYWTDNFTKYNSTWSSITNTSYALVNEPLWTANYTAYNDSWSSTANDSYMLNTGDTSTGNYDFGGNVRFRDGTTKFYSIEAGKTDWRITVNTQDADLPKIYNYDEGEAVFKSMQFGGTSTAGIGLTVTELGKVGIGTTTPRQSLTIGVTDDTADDQKGTLGIKCDATHRGIMLQENVGGEQWSIGVNAVGDLGFFDSGDATSGITFQDVTGNVGIGTASPQNLFNVLGDGNFTGTLYVDEVDISTEPLWTGNYTAYNDSWSSTVNGSYVLKAGDTMTGNLILPSANTPNTPALAFGDGDTGFYEESDDWLQVSVGGTHQFEFASDFFQGVGANAGRMFNEVATATNPTFAPSRTDGDTGVGWAAADQLSLIAGGVEGHRITYSAGTITNYYTGEVGINIINPANTLEVVQTQTSGRSLYVHRNLPSASTNSIVALIHQDNAGDDQGAFVIRQDGSGDIFNLNDGGTEVFTVLDGGDVGIGTTSPDAQLDVSGSSAAGYKSLRVRSGGDSSIPSDSFQILFSYSGANTYSHNIRTRHHATDNSGNAIDFYTWDKDVDSSTTPGTQHIMTLQGDQKVGINDLTPSYTLDVNGQLRAIDYYSGDGTQGMTSTCSEGFTIKDGLVTACSGTTSYWSAGSAAFTTKYPDFDDIVNTGASVTPTGNGIEFLVSVSLPHGAVVTSAVIHGNAAATAETWYLRKYSTTGGVAAMATANIGTADTSISSATIDNQNYAYGFYTSSLDNGDAIYGAYIIYTI